MKTLYSFIALSLLEASAPFVQAAVEPVAIMLAGSFEQARYVVPPGKVLIIEHVLFNDWWDGQADQKQIVIMHSTNPVGTVWQTTLRFGVTYNTLTRPLRIPESKAVTITQFGNSLFRCWLHGLLVDVRDLYAAVPASIQETQGEVLPTGETLLQGSIELASARPAAIRVLGSDDLETWQSEPRAQVTGTGNPSTKTLRVESEESQRFIRVEAHALPREEPPIVSRLVAPWSAP